MHRAYLAVCLVHPLDHSLKRALYKQAVIHLVFYSDGSRK